MFDDSCSVEEEDRLDKEQEEYFRLIEQKKLNPREQLLRAYSLDGKYEPVSCIIPKVVLTAKAHTILPPDRLPHETDIPDGIFTPVFQKEKWLLLRDSLKKTHNITLRKQSGLDQSIEVADVIETAIKPTKSGIIREKIAKSILSETYDLDPVIKEVENNQNNNESLENIQSGRTIKSKLVPYGANLEKSVADKVYQNTNSLIAERFKLKTINNSKFLNDFDALNPEIIRTRPCSRARSAAMHPPVDIKYFDGESSIMSEIEENVKPRFSVPIPIKLPVPLAKPITAGNGGDLHDLDALSGVTDNQNNNDGTKDNREKFNLTSDFIELDDEIFDSKDDIIKNINKVEVNVHQYNTNISVDIKTNTNQDDTHSDDASRMSSLVSNLNMDMFSVQLLDKRVNAIEEKLNKESRTEIRHLIQKSKENYLRNIRAEYAGYQDIIDKRKKYNIEFNKKIVDERKEISAFRQQLLKNLKENNDPLIGVFMRYFTDDLALDFMETYKGYQMSIDAVLAVIGSVLEGHYGTGSYTPTASMAELPEEPNIRPNKSAISFSLSLSNIKTNYKELAVKKQTNNLNNIINKFDTTIFEGKSTWETNLQGAENSSLRSSTKSHLGGGFKKSLKYIGKSNFQYQNTDPDQWLDEKTKLKNFNNLDSTPINVLHNALDMENHVPSKQEWKVLSDEQLLDIGTGKKKFDKIFNEIKYSHNRDMTLRKKSMSQPILDTSDLFKLDRLDKSTNLGLGAHLPRVLSAAEIHAPRQILTAPLQVVIDGKFQPAVTPYTSHPGTIPESTKIAAYGVPAGAGLSILRKKSIKKNIKVRI